MVKITSIIMVGLMCFGMFGCNNDDKKNNTPPIDSGYLTPDYDTYKNPIEIEGQWGSSSATGANGQYGIGDPFIMRFNGKYYMYPSTSDPCDGIKVFESSDLVHWIDRGFAVLQSEDTARGAYAPEVIYYDGFFYMCQSQGGRGHYIYQSNTPLGPFSRISNNLGKGIDGSFYLADDGMLYLLHTGKAGKQELNYAPITDIKNGEVGVSRAIKNANLNHWIEGPSIFRRGDYTYLTYTGNHVFSSGYRVAYSYQKGFSGFNDFIQPKQNVNIISTTSSYYGLGHSSNAIGPNLDSLYTAYHNLVGNGPARRYNLANYFTSGGLLLSNGAPNYDVATPTMPIYYNDGTTLENVGKRKLSTVTPLNFTAELNFIGNGELVLAYKSDEDYCSIKFNNDKISLYRVIDDKETLLKSAPATLYNGKINTVRVESGSEKTFIYLNNMKKLDINEGLGAGKVGYGDGISPLYTAVSEDVFGTSDFEMFKNTPSEFPAISYLKTVNRGFYFSNGKVNKSGVRQGEKENTKQVENEYAVSLSSKYDFVKYALNVSESSTYTLMANVTSASAGSKIRVTADDKSYEFTVPKLNGEKTNNVILGEIELTKGISTLKIELLDGVFEPITFKTTKTEPFSLKTENFRSLRSAATITSNCITSPNEPFYGDFGVTGQGNYDVTMDVTIKSYGANYSGGIAFLANDYSYLDAQPAYSFRGYLLAINEKFITLQKCDYGQSYLESKVLTDNDEGAFALNKSNKVRIKLENGNITIFINGTMVISYFEDTFITGSIGLFTNNLSIELKILQ